MLPSRKLEELRVVVHRHLQANDIYSQLRSFVTDFVKEKDTSGLTSEDELLQAVQEKGVVDELLKSLREEGTGTSVAFGPSFGSGVLPLKLPAFEDADESSRRGRSHSDLPKSGGVYLHIRILSGSAFGIDGDEDPHSQCTLHMAFKGQRCSSRPVTYEAEPQFDDSFLVTLRESKESGSPLLHIQEKIEVVVVRTEKSGETSLVGTQKIDWRKVLSSGFLSLAVELLGSANAGGAALSAGVLNLRLQLLPSAKRFILPEIEVGRTAAQERASEGQIERKFFAFAKSWWKEYLSLRPSHAQRIVKIFGAAEDGSLRPVFSFLADVRPGRYLESPRHALRFVSVLPLDSDETFGEGRSDIWHSLHTVLAKGKATVEEKGILLCSLLHSFGLDAYCVMGSCTADSGANHGVVWCVSLTPGMEWGAGEGVVLWDPLGGGRYDNLNASVRDIPLNTVGCIFNKNNFLANIQASDAIGHVRFDIGNPRHWKAMGSAMVQPVAESLTPSSGPIPLLPSTHNVFQIEQAVEDTLRALVVEHRRHLGLYTLWDESLGFILSSALSAYETERIVGVTVGNADFQHSVKRAVPEGNTFKGFPVQFVHRDPARMMGALKASTVAQDILATRGDGVSFGLRVKAFAYAESAISVW
eukprot:CAMPEP_0113908950 /NCGR_PEP_ID=MMETSP0780_2-20120614/26506_1 /TAXON_ID=652834 /ORGANISM="Palpitomonas bilix" /LENGTH=642 /DNA_ID=CAMNT_0000904555 /DNA_START=152 /DNA_END=2077 /DNA_ORIENTATION=- /assembly_acc=CAM_ASM_000599